MSTLIEPHNMSEWYTLIKEAKKRIGYDCDDHLESYLILTLDSYLTDPSLESSILAIEFLESIELNGEQSKHRLRRLGDRCLMLSGLFPNRAEKLNVSRHYFSNIGQDAYQTLSVHAQKKHHAKLFNQLSIEFKALANLLSAMRHSPEDH